MTQIPLDIKNENGSGSYTACSIQNLLAEAIRFESLEFDISEERLSSSKLFHPSFQEGHSKMVPFPSERVDNFKHVIYNLLVEHYNGSNAKCLVSPCTVHVNGEPRCGFQFNKSADPNKSIPELYAVHARNARLDLANQDSIFIQDCYKFYLRSALELLGKYFIKSTVNPATAKYTFLYDKDVPLFIPGGSLQEADERIGAMKTRSRKRFANNTSVSKKKVKH